MKKIVIAILVFFAFSWISVVSAGDWHGKRGNWPRTGSPESTVTCAAGNGAIISNRSVPNTINVDECEGFVGLCAPCIISLEDQGCKIVDVVVTHKPPHNSMTTYLLSCDGY